MRGLLPAALCLAAASVAAQDEAAGAAAPEPMPQATELAPVRVIGRRPDPFAFRNPVEAQDTVFSRDWDEPPGLEEIGMRGGIVQIAINKGLELTAKGIRSLPYWQNQVVGAQARPPPLDEAQLARASRQHQGDAEAAGARPQP